MKEIKCSNGMVAIVDDDCFELLNRWNWHMNNKGYAVRNSNVLPKDKLIFMHRVLCYLSFGDIPEGFFVDHANGNKLDNRLENLRLADGSQSMMNRTKYAKSSSKFKGVSKAGKNIWQTRIMARGISVSLGRFDNEVDAAKEYDRAALKYHGEFARLNFP